MREFASYILLRAAVDAHTRGHTGTHRHPQAQGHTGAHTQGKQAHTQAHIATHRQADRHAGTPTARHRQEDTRSTRRHIKHTGLTRRQTTGQ